MSLFCKVNEMRKIWRARKTWRITHPYILNRLSRNFFDQSLMKESYNIIGQRDPTRTFVRWRESSLHTVRELSRQPTRHNIAWQQIFGQRDKNTSWHGRQVTRPFPFKSKQIVDSKGLRWIWRVELLFTSDFLSEDSRDKNFWVIEHF